MAKKLPPKPPNTKIYSEDDVVLDEKDLQKFGEMISVPYDDIISPVEPINKQEMKFLEMYFLGMAIPSACKVAGYKHKTKETLMAIGRKIIAKYEGSKEHREIMLRMGFGPVRVVSLLIDMAENGKSENARVQALNITTKCLGMQRDIMEAGSGAELIIRRSFGEGVEPPEPVSEQPTPVEKTKSAPKLIRISGSTASEDEKEVR